MFCSLGVESLTPLFSDTKAHGSTDQFPDEVYGRALRQKEVIQVFGPKRASFALLLSVFISLHSIIASTDLLKYVVFSIISGICVTMTKSMVHDRVGLLTRTQT